MRTFPAFKQAALTAALVASLAFSAGAAAKTFHWSYQGDASSMDPMALNETFTLGFQGNIYETLAGYDGELKLTPLLAESWENPEPTKWIFCRKGVKFHDGSPFTADDVIFTWKRSLTPVHEGATAPRRPTSRRSTTTPSKSPRPRPTPSCRANGPSCTS